MKTQKQFVEDHTRPQHPNVCCGLPNELIVVPNQRTADKEMPY